MNLKLKMMLALSTCLCVAGWILCPVSDGRGGGGHSFSGGGSHGGGGGGFHGGGGGGSSHYGGGYSGSHSYGYGSGSSGGSWVGIVVGIIVVVLVIAFVIFIMNVKVPETSEEPYELEEERGKARKGIEELRTFDANFSESLFLDFVYALYARLQEARGHGKLDDFEPYVTEGALNQMRARGGPTVTSVHGVIVGSSRIARVGSDEENDLIDVELEANYTEVFGGEENAWYSKEKWSFMRLLGNKSLPPDKIAALHCPKCGAPLERNSEGACNYCGTVVQAGQFHWCVRGIVVLELESKGPLLTETVEEVGTDSLTVYDPGLSEDRERLTTNNPGFSWERTEARFRYIFLEVQSAWTTLEWERVRPFETDNVFQTHQYWIEEYKRQHLRNVLEEIEIGTLEAVKFDEDAYYDAITVRIFASMKDYTVDASGDVVCGSSHKKRPFSEYWTFIRRRGVAENTKQDTSCPNCGAQLKINMTGVCEYCGGKVSSGEFDWVLSRIEQDEAYAG